MTTTILSTAKPAKVSKHVGNIGDRVHVEGVVRKIFDFGMTVVHDTDGNEFTLRTRKLASKPGVLVIFEGTISGHSEYKGTKRTEIGGFSQQRVTDEDADRIRAAL